MMKKLTALICIFLIIFSLVSCSTQASYVDEESDDNPLQVYLISWSDSEKEAIGKFNALVSKGDIDSQRIEITEFQFEPFDQIDEMYNRIASEIMAGEGPDIIFIDHYFCTRNDFVKIASQGAFADMDILSANSSTFNYADYNQMVMDAAVIDGIRPFMPISYSVPYIYSTEEAFVKSGIEVPDKLTYEKTLGIIDTFEQNREKKHYGIYRDLLVFDTFSKNPSVTMDDEIFILIQNRVRNMYIENNNEIDSSYLGYIVSGDSMFDTGWFFTWNQFDQIMINYTLIKKQYDNNLVFWGLPCNKDGSTKAFIDRAIAININSKHKNDAFKFVEYMMSYDYSASQSKTNSCITLPVNTKAYNELKHIFNQSSFSFNTMEDAFITTSLPDNLAGEYINLIESPQICEFNGQAVYLYQNIIRESLHDYYMQKIDYDTMMEQLERKLSLYYSE